MSSVTEELKELKKRFEKLNAHHKELQKERTTARARDRVGWAEWAESCRILFGLRLVALLCSV